MSPEPFSWRDDPEVPAFPDDHPLIVFDGECVLCSANARFVLDVCGLQFLDSSGLRALLACRDRARSAGVPLTLAVAAGPVTRLLDVAGVRDWFHYE